MAIQALTPPFEVAGRRQGWVPRPFTLRERTHEISLIKGPGEPRFRRKRCMKPHAIFPVVARVPLARFCDSVDAASTARLRH
jgi:hypothetical protein